MRVLLDDGKLMRLNYEAANGHPYYAVGRWLIDRNIVPKDEMSMDRIREWMERNPKEGKELRRRNKSYVFFRETHLPANEEPIGAQGISLTPGRSIAVDRKLHTYGTPFFISAYLPIERLKPDTWFRRLMIAQDTGGAIVGPARADLYFGAGDEAAQRRRPAAPRRPLRHAGAEGARPGGATTRFRCRGGGRPSRRWRPTKRRAGQGRSRGRRKPSGSQAGSVKTEARPKPAAKPRPRSRGNKADQERRRRKPRAKGRESRRRQKACEEAQARRPNREVRSQAKVAKPSRPGTTLRHEQAAAERRRARPVEGRHPFDRAAAEALRKPRPMTTCRRRPRPRRSRAPNPRPRSRRRPRRRSRAAPPPLAPLTRKTKKRIARGAHAIDGRLDLHGMTQAEAHDALFGFLRAKQARGGKVVLVITGKGARGGDDAAAAACSSAWCRSGCGCRNSAA